MSDVDQDLKLMVGALKLYTSEGAREAPAYEIEEPRTISYVPEMQKPLDLVRSYKGRFVAVDCSTKPLMRGNRFGVYLLRPAYASVDPSNKEEPVTWGLMPQPERICAVVGDLRVRGYELERLRAEFESELAESLLPHIEASDYLFLDGASYFGARGRRRFSVDVYEKASQRGMKFLTISKNSPSLLDEKGRDLIAQVAIRNAESTRWVYHPVPELKADKKNRWGDVSLMKLSPDSFRIFRCDIMDYLAEGDVVQLLSPLTSIADDPRCVGYPVCLYLAHEFAKVGSDAKLLYFRELVEKALAAVDEDLLHALKLEESLSNFRSELYGMRYMWQMNEQQMM